MHSLLKNGESNKPAGFVRIVPLDTLYETNVIFPTYLSTCRLHKVLFVPHFVRLEIGFPQTNNLIWELAVRTETVAYCILHLFASFRKQRISKILRYSFFIRLPILGRLPEMRRCKDLFLSTCT